jgi:hypothetical protein
VLDRLKSVGAGVKSGSYSHLRPRHVARLTAAYARDRRGRRHYRLLSEAELLATRSSGTAFVFGSGRSLLDIGEDEWAAIARCNTISLREFPRQHWVRADYHLTCEVDALDEYAGRLRANPLYAGAVFVVAGGFMAHMGNELIGGGLLPEGARVFRYRRRARAVYEPPSHTPRELVHGYNSIFDATNFAFAMGYRRIVLAGVDYYNKEYFWLEPGEARAYEKPGVAATSRWPQAEAIVEMMSRWSHELAAEGVELAVYNPRSLLAQELRVFRF